MTTAPRPTPRIDRPAKGGPEISSVGELLDAYEGMINRAATLEAEANQLSGGLLLEAGKLRQEAEIFKKGVLRSAIERYGNYEKDDRGRKAILEKRQSISYDPDKLRDLLPDLVRAHSLIITTESVDKRKLEGLLNAGVVRPETVEPAMIVETTRALVVRI